MATSLTSVNQLIRWYLSSPPDVRLNRLLATAPIKDDESGRDRAALRRVYKQLERIEGARNVLLEEFANDRWQIDQLDLFDTDGAREAL